MSDDLPRSLPKDRDALDTIWKIFDRTKKISLVVIAILVLLQLVAIFWLEDSAFVGAQTGFHAATLILLYSLAEGGSRLTRYLQEVH